jgi:thiol-disulfide isomerase/thioredoxin
MQGFKQFVDARPGPCHLGSMPKSDKTVVVFLMTGCHACHDYLPKFRRVAVKYRPFVAIKQVTFNGTNGEIVDTYKIKAFPTTVILDAAEKAVKKVEGSVTVAEIEKIFKAASEG